MLFLVLRLLISPRILLVSGNLRATAIAAFVFSPSRMLTSLRTYLMRVPMTGRLRLALTIPSLASARLWANLLKTRGRHLLSTLTLLLRIAKAQWFAPGPLVGSLPIDIVTRLFLGAHPTVPSTIPSKTLCIPAWLSITQGRLILARQA